MLGGMQRLVFVDEWCMVNLPPGVYPAIEPVPLWGVWAETHTGMHRASVWRSPTPRELDAYRLSQLGMAEQRSGWCPDHGYKAAVQQLASCRRLRSMGA
jgi:hypothetical protein